MDGAQILFRMAYICSNCETALRLKVSERIPTHCPYCKAKFMNGTSTERVINDHEETITKLKSPEGD